LPDNFRRGGPKKEWVGMYGACYGTPVLGVFEGSKFRQTLKVTKRGLRCSNDEKKKPARQGEKTFEYVNCWVLDFGLGERGGRKGLGKKLGFLSDRRV